MQSVARPPASATVVAEPLWVQVLVWIVLPLLGAGAGWLLKLSASWVADLPLRRFQRPFEFVESLSDPTATIGAIVVGGMEGLVLAFLAAIERLTVTVSDDRLALARGDSRREVERVQVSAVFMDGKQLVLLGRATEVLAKESSDLSADSLRDAFVIHGYTWLSDGDPYKDDYRRWVEDTPDVSASANALFKVRQRALDERDNDDAADLRREMAKLGLVVRDEQKRQYWRGIEQDYDPSGDAKRA